MYIHKRFICYLWESKDVNGGEFLRSMEARLVEMEREQRRYSKEIANLRRDIEEKVLRESIAKVTYMYII